MRTTEVKDLLPMNTKIKPRLADEPKVMVTPYLHKYAIAQVRAHEQANKAPGFVMALETMRGVCPNCQGFGGVFVKLCAGGPYPSPRAGAVCTWFEGNGQWGKGWYVVKSTAAYWCPDCHPEKYVNGNMISTELQEARR